ncbi:MAG: leucine-rich repeat domain-containing protein, partial [Anaeroplasmataceae bacterium]|nr:leucine-rich repeat domain-containing protein [Anaeroplasmataceae bacterium]
YNIGGGALYYNDYLLAYQSTMYSSQEVEIKDNVRLIAAGAFSGNTRITSVVLPDSIQAIEDYTFSNCSNLVSVTIPNGVTRIGDGAFSRCISLTSINLPMSVKNIGNRAFYNCVNLTSINLPNFLTSIGDNAFSNCVALTSITLPSSLTSISEDAFEECYRLVELYNLSNVVIEQGKNNYIKVTHTSLDEKSCIIEDDDFVYIKDNENIYYLIQYKGKDSKCELPVQIEDHSYEIHAGAFYRDDFICELVMPSSIKKIGKMAFSFLGSVFYDGTIEDWCSIDFADWNSMPSITVLYLKNAENSWEQIFEIVIPETITQINPYQFYGFEYFQGKIIVPKSVINIGKYAIRAKKIIYMGSKEE